MATRFCSMCGQKVRFPDDTSRRAGKCPKCGAEIPLGEPGVEEDALDFVEIDEAQLAPTPEPEAPPPPPPPPPAEPPPGRRPRGRRRRRGSRRPAQGRPDRGPARGAPAGYEQHPEDRSARRGAARGGRRPPRGSSNATTIFVLGLLGLLICAILAPIAWVMGNEELKRCRRDRIRPDGLAVAGRILGIIGTIWMIVALLLVLLVFCAAPGPSPEMYPGLVF